MARVQVLKIEVPANVSKRRIELKTLPNNWNDVASITRAVGDQWLATSKTLLFEVPSVLVPETWNVLINPLHPEAGRLKIIDVFRHPYEPRLLP